MPKSLKKPSTPSVPLSSVHNVVKKNRRPPRFPKQSNLKCFKRSVSSSLSPIRQTRYPWLGSTFTHILIQIFNTINVLKTQYLNNRSKVNPLPFHLKKRPNLLTPLPSFLSLFRLLPLGFLSLHKINVHIFPPKHLFIRDLNPLNNGDRSRRSSSKTRETTS